MPVLRIASGSDITLDCMQPELVEVMADSEDELLCRYACLQGDCDRRILMTTDVEVRY